MVLYGFHGFRHSRAGVPRCARTKIRWPGARLPRDGWTRLPEIVLLHLDSRWDLVSFTSQALNEPTGFERCSGHSIEWLINVLAGIRGNLFRTLLSRQLYAALLLCTHFVPFSLYILYIYVLCTCPCVCICRFRCTLLDSVLLGQWLAVWPPWRACLQKASPAQ